MGTFYSVIRYVPNPITEESVNIGVVVFGDGAPPQFRFLDNWRRAQAFGGERTGFLRDFAKDAQERNLELFDSDVHWDEAKLQRALGKWHNSIQFTPPRGSLKASDVLLKQMAGLYLGSAVSQAEPRSPARGRHYAAAIALRHVREAIRERFGLPGVRALIAKDPVLKGQYGEHEFDLLLKNGHALLAANALSFSVPDTIALRRDVDATAFALEDVKRKIEDLRTGVVVVPPSGASSLYDRSKRMFAKLGVEVVEEKAVPAWAHRAVGKFPQDVLAGRKEGRGRRAARVTANP